MSAADQRWWFDNTPGGMLARALGNDPFAIDHEAADAQVEATRQHYRRVYQRELSESEIASVRHGAELRSAPASAMREAPRTVPEIVALVNSRNPGAGWYWKPSMPPGAGVATFQDGRWTGDAAVVGAVQGAEAERVRQAAEAGDEWANGPLIMRTVARPT